MDDSLNKTSRMSYKERLLNLFEEKGISHSRNKNYVVMEEMIKNCSMKCLLG